MNSLNTKSLPLIGIIIPCFNEAQNILRTSNLLREKLNHLSGQEKINNNSFLIFVDDGSKDLSWDFIARECAKYSNVKGIRLSRNFGHQIALMAGIFESVNLCDATISIDADLQQDISAIDLFIEEFNGGYDIVLGVRESRSSDTLFKKLSANCYYWIMRLMGINLTPNHSDYRLLSERASRSLMLYEEPHLFLRGLIHELGFKVSIVKINVKERVYGLSKYSLKKMLILGIDGITSFSVVPLRLTLLLGVIFFICSVGMTIYIAFQKIFFEATVPGWASTVVPIYFIGGIQLLSLGLIGEYLGKIFITVKKRPRWIIQEKC